MQGNQRKQRKGLSESVYQYIIEQILTGEIEAGEKIPEDKLAAKFGISRTPIREALRQLHGEGLVKIYPKRFAEVISFTDEDIKNIGIVRLNQDILAAQLAIYNGSNADFDEMQMLSDKCRYYDRQGDLYRRISTDAEFHLMLSKISGNPLLYSMQENLYKKVCLLMLYNNPESECNINLHDKIVEGLKKRDTGSVISSLIEHLAVYYNLSGISYTTGIDLDLHRQII